MEANSEISAPVEKNAGDPVAVRTIAFVDGRAWTSRRAVDNIFMSFEDSALTGGLANVMTETPSSRWPVVTLGAMTWRLR